MNNSSLQASVEQLLIPFLEERGVELVELQMSGSSRRPTMRLFVDRQGGITVGECTQISRDFADVMDTEDPIESSYVLQVSSPGLTRQLKTSRDYNRSLGRILKLVVEGEGDLVGTLESFSDTELLLRVGDEIKTVQTNTITRANLHFDMQDSLRKTST
jgi:ribosome maturation factor RimP